MQNFILALKDVLAVSDLKLVIALDGNNVTIQISPKAKEGNTEFPSLNFAGHINEIDEKFGEQLALKLKKNLPLISNINTYDKNLAKLEENKKTEVTKKATEKKPETKKPTVAKKETSGLELKTEESGKENDDDDDENNGHAEQQNTVANLTEEKPEPKTEELTPAQEKLF